VPHHALRRSDLATWISPRFVERGERYQREGRVLSAQRRARGAGEVVSGRVRGSREHVYSVHVALEPEPGGGVAIDGDCSCPVGYNCKHVAALLLGALERQEAGAPVASAAPPAAGAGPDLDAWLARVASAREGAARAAGAAPERTRLLYLLDALAPEDVAGPLRVRLVTCRLLKAGGLGKPAPFHPERAAQPYPPRFLAARDLEILRLLESAAGRESSHAFVLDADAGARALGAMLETGRCHWREPHGSALAAGPIRSASFAWRLGDDARLRLVLESEPPPARIATTAPPWYLDLDAGRAGPIEAGIAPGVAAALAAAPALEAEQAAAPPAALAETLDALGLPRPPRLRVREIGGPPVPRLRLLPGDAEAPPEPGPWWQVPMPRPPRAAIEFEYGGHRLPPADEEEPIVHLREGDTPLRVHRDPAAEDQAVEALFACGLAPWMDPFALDPEEEDGGPPFALVMDTSDWSDAHPALPWLHFLRHDLPRLRDAGWAIEVDPGFDHRLLVPERWVGELGAGDGSQRWLDVDIGIVVDGETIPLLPVLHEVFAGPGAREAQRALEDREGGGDLLVPAPDGAWLCLPGERVRAILDTLVELHDPELRLRSNALRVPDRRAAELAALAGDRPGAVHWRAAERIETLAARVRAFEGVAPRPAPPAFPERLRPYQEHGLGWLQFLRELGFGGILADDMGLGKTVQTLAHLLLEQDAGRLDRPSLVVAPTSVLANWAREARRFAPSLRVLVLHGPDRGQRFASVPESDLVITSYALAHRDRETLAAHAWHLLVLDEAQAIKNPRAKAGQALRALDARHRLCLTGTPLENHLGELWSLLDFVEPGLLGDPRQFRRLYRRPVEKEGDERRRAALARRIAPFLLRRTKDEVTPELPEKVEIEQLVELHPEQRDVYESIRVAMHDKVRAALAARGLERSRVVVLDALLKLRQICCDPRLVKLDSVRRIRRSAKLDLLMELLPEMIDEGRRVLVFSQFTSMLGLIEEALAGEGIEHVKLTGRTRDRDAPVRRFQAGEVPLFLVSLKAGGTGLNLTRADTVIHYDPWWNPAVEAQATDRAHRIGQERKVFVYRLITGGTVEQRMLGLQGRKRALARSMLAGREAGGGVDLSREDLEHLLEPLGA